MWSVDSRSANKISRIPAKTSAAIKSWWLGKASQEEKALALQEIKTAHRRLQWFGCDCITSGELPALAPALRKETYFLRRLTSRAAHVPTCAFNFEQTIEKPEGKHASTGIGSMGGTPDFGPTTTGSTIKDRGAEANAAHSESRSAPVPAIAKRLWWLLQASGNQETPLSSPIPKLMAVVNEIPFREAKLKDVFFYSPRAIEEGWVDACLKRQSSAKATPTCWQLIELTSANLEGKRVSATSWKTGAQVEYPVDGPLRIWGGDVSPARFPMLALAKIEGDTQGKRIAELYAQPIYKSGSWLLVDSNNERQTLRDLISVGEWLFTEKGIRTTIEKPLFDWNQTGEKPDFVMSQKTAKGETQFCVIETIGYDTDEYAQRKNELRTTLMRHAEVIMDYRASNSQASRDLKSAVARWALRSTQ